MINGRPRHWGRPFSIPSAASRLVGPVTLAQAIQRHRLLTGFLAYDDPIILYKKNLTFSPARVIFCEKSNTMSHSTLTRFSISMPGALVERLDAMASAAGFANRSQAVTKLVRDALVEHESVRDGRDIAGTITLVYDHHKPNLQALLTAVQHDYGQQIVSTLHVHLNHDTCLEVLVVRGAVRKVEELADRLIAAKGIHHGRLTVTVTDAAE